MAHRQPNWNTRRFATNKASFRSGLEEKIAKEITAEGHQYKFESFKIPYSRPETQHNYTADFLLKNGIVIESKGLFKTEDRQKHILIKKQYPDLDLRMVFSNANARIAKKSRTTYAAWCDKNDIRWAHRSIPTAWLEEPINLKSVAQLRKLGAS